MGGVLLVGCTPETTRLFPNVMSLGTQVQLFSQGTKRKVKI